MPMSLGRVIYYARSLPGPAISACHIGLGTRFIEKYQTARIDATRPFDPRLTLEDYVFAMLLARM